MVRSKPELFLTVPSAVDPQTYTSSDLITPPYHVVSAPPPLATPRPLPSRQSSSSTSTSRSSASESSDFDFDSNDSPLRLDTSPWTMDSDAVMTHIDEPVCPFELSKPSPSLSSKLSQSALQNNGSRGHRSLAATRRRLLKLARETYTPHKDDRMEIDSNAPSSAMLKYHLFFLKYPNDSVARARSHPYARFAQPPSPFLTDVQFQNLPLASPFHEKKFDIPLSPSPNPMEETTMS